MYIFMLREKTSGIFGVVFSGSLLQLMQSNCTLYPSRRAFDSDGWTTGTVREASWFLAKV